MRRALVLTSESARHPFRASLPPHVFAEMGEIEPRVPWYLRLGLSRADIESAATTYCSGFVAAFVFFA
tara:strand:- start:26430 stop:26633 length:204 start_codon:yes stop_codon:yes gene_type:complete